MELVASPSNLLSQQAAQSPTGYPGCPPLKSSSSLSVDVGKLWAAKLTTASAAFTPEDPTTNPENPHFQLMQPRHSTTQREGEPFLADSSPVQHEVSHAAAMVSPPWHVAAHLTSPVKGARAPRQQHPTPPPDPIHLCSSGLLSPHCESSQGPSALTFPALATTSSHCLPELFTFDFFSLSSHLKHSHAPPCHI